jgi:hypothetical protein
VPTSTLVSSDEFWDALQNITVFIIISRFSADDRKARGNFHSTKQFSVQCPGILNV